MNLLVKTPETNEYSFVSQTDVVNVLFAGVLKTNLQGAGSIPIKKIGLIRKVLQTVKVEDRALQAFRIMSKLGIQSVAVVSHHKVEPCTNLLLAQNSKRLVRSICGAKCHCSSYRRSQVNV